MGGEKQKDSKQPPHRDDIILLSHARNEVQRFAQLRQEMADRGDMVKNAGNEAGMFDSFDFGNRGISQLPEELVDIIKDHAERLALDRNWLSSLSGLAPRFSEFNRLKYLVVRFNELEEFPRAVLDVPTLEYLDLRANKISVLPEDLSRLKNIKVVCVKSNRIKRVPLCIAGMTSMQFIVLDKNPIEFPEKRLWKGSNQEHENERQRQIEETVKVKKLLQQHQSQEHRSTEGESSENTTEAPRLYKRRPAGAGRFPIKPSISGINIDGISDDSRNVPLAIKSAMLHPKKTAGLPPTPRSAAIRPGIEPLATSDRNRSNSESLMSTSVRKKRMGIQMSRGGKGSAEGIDIGPLTAEPERLSHLRGASVGPVLLNNTVVNGSAIADSPDPASPYDGRDSQFSRLSSLPENKRKSQHRNQYVELAQDVLFAIEQVEAPVKTVAHASKSSGPKRRGLERAYQVFISGRADLEVALTDHAAQDEENEPDYGPMNGRRNSTSWVAERCGLCLEVFQKLSESLDAHLPLIVEHVNPRYVRLLMHLLFASTVEIRNGYGRVRAASCVAEIESVASAPSVTSDTATVRPASPSPRPTTSLRIRDPGRMRNGSQPMNRNKPLPSPRMTSASLASARRPSFAQRTQEVNNTLTPQLTPSTSFISTNTNLTEFDDHEEDQLFETIFKKLSVATDSASQTLPQCGSILHDAKRKFLDGHTTSVHSGAAEMYDLLLHHCANANDAAYELKAQLKTLKVRETRARDQSDFWQLCTGFTMAYFTFAKNVKSQSNLGIVPLDIQLLLKPLHQSVKSVSRAIEQSPWRTYAVHCSVSGTPTSAEPTSAVFGFPPSLNTARSSTFSTNTHYASTPGLNSMSVMTPRTAQLPHTQSYASTHGLPNLALQTSFSSSGSNTTGPPTASFNNSFGSFSSTHSSNHTGTSHGSGYTTPLPATPISAALGAAAQATIASNGTGLGLYNSSGYHANGNGPHDHPASSGNVLPPWYNPSTEGNVSRKGSTAGVNGLGLSRSTTTSRSVSRSVSQRR